MAKKSNRVLRTTHPHHWLLLSVSGVISLVIAIAFIITQNRSLIEENPLVQEISSSTSSAAAVLSQLYSGTSDTHNNLSRRGASIVDQLLRQLEDTPQFHVDISSAPILQKAGIEVDQDGPASAELEAGLSEEPIGVDQDISTMSTSAHVDLLEWMLSKGLSFPNVEVVHYKGTEEHRGILAKRDIEIGEELIAIPHHFIINHAGIMKTEFGQSVVAAIPSYSDEENCHELIAMFLMHERVLGSASWWHRFIASLPKSFANMPIHFTPEEALLLEESRLGPIHLWDQELYQSAYENICDHMAEFCIHHSLEMYIWARLTVRSRVFGIEIDGVPTTAVMPFADLINHDFDSVASWQFNDSLRQGEIYSKKRISKGAPITISYGTKANRVLLRSYGFAMPNNPYETAVVFIQLPDHEAESGMLMKRVAITGNPDTEFYRLSHTVSLKTDDEGFKAGLELCRVAVATPDELDHMTDGKSIVSLRNEQAALRYFELAIETQMYKYSQSIDDDEALLASDSLSANTRNIILTRFGEKGVLIKMLDIVGDLAMLADPDLSESRFIRARFQPVFAEHANYIRQIADLRRQISYFL